MGTWSEDLLGNDAAADIELLWKDFVESALTPAPLAWDGEKVFALFKRLYFRNQPDWGNPSVCSEVFALGALFRRHSLSPSGELRDWLIEAASVELGRDRLREWPSPTKRKKALESLLKELQATPCKVVSGKKELLKTYTAFAKQYPRWIDAVLIGKLDEDFERLYPAFLDDIRMCIEKGIGEPGDDWHFELRQQRLMQLAFYVGWKIGLSDKEIVGLISSAEKTKGMVLL